MENGLVTEGFIRSKDFMKLLGIGKSTFYRMIKQGKIEQGFKLGERIRAWRKEYVNKLISSFTKDEIPVEANL